VSVPDSPLCASAMQMTVQASTALQIQNGVLLSLTLVAAAGQLAIAAFSAMWLYNNPTAGATKQSARANSVVGIALVFVCALLSWALIEPFAMNTPWSGESRNLVLQLSFVAFIAPSEWQRFFLQADPSQAKRIRWVALVINIVNIFLVFLILAPLGALDSGFGQYVNDHHWVTTVVIVISFAQVAILVGYRLTTIDDWLRQDCNRLAVAFIMRASLVASFVVLVTSANLPFGNRDTTQPLPAMNTGSSSDVLAGTYIISVLVYLYSVLAMYWMSPVRPRWFGWPGIFSGHQPIAETYTDSTHSSSSSQSQVELSTSSTVQKEHPF
jgi:hypothetical protein